MSTFRENAKTVTLIGYLGGLLYAGFEGIRAIVMVQIGPTSKTMRSFGDLVGVLAAPVAVYPLPFVIGVSLFFAVTWVFWRRHAARLAEPARIGFLTGVAAALGLAIWAVFTTNPILTKMALLSPSRILVNFQEIGIAVLAGIGIALLTSTLCRRFSPRALALTVGAVWPALMIAGVALFWTKRNLTFWRSPILGLIALVGLILVFVALWVIFRMVLARIYTPSAGAVRHLVLPVLLMALSVVAVVYNLTPKVPTLTRGTTDRGVKVILFTIDTLRPDHLGCYGYDRTTSPVIDSLAKNGAMFTRARSQSPWTLSSLASLLTSTNPSVNAVLTGNNRLEEARTTIAEAVQQGGVLTQAIVSNGWLMDNFGLAQGFDGYHHSAEVFNLSRFQRMIWLRIARKLRPDLFPLGENFLVCDLVDTAIDWLEKYHERDFFLWIHSIDPHDPYQPPAEYRKLYAEEPYKGRFQLGSGQIYNLRIGARLSPAEKDQLERLYDQEIRYTDDHISRLIDTLNRLDISDETLVIISSDHGEEFWEHDGLMHGHTLYDEQLLVPLILHYPERIPPGLVIDRPVRLLDLMPTILDLYDLEMPDEMQGTSMLQLIQDPESNWASAPSYAEALLYFDELKSVVQDDYKLVLNPSTGKIMLFDLAADQEEQHDLKTAEPEITEKLRDQLVEWIAESERLAESLPHSSDGSKARIDPETEAQLRALGYLH